MSKERSMIRPPSAMGNPRVVQPPRAVSQPLDLRPAESDADPETDFDITVFPDTIEGMEAMIRKVKVVQNAASRDSARRAREMLDRAKRLRGYVIALQTRINEKRKGQG